MIVVVWIQIKIICTKHFQNKKNYKLLSSIGAL